MQPTTLVPIGKKIRLTQYEPDDTGGIESKKDAREELMDNITALADLGYRLYAEDRRSLLLVLQGMDTSGKDGTIRHVMQGFNPQSCQVVSFKQPSLEELDHDFLWRIACRMPRKGHISIFNRSHYEDVLVVRVHNLVPEAEWRTRYDRINAFEKLAADGGVKIVKIFLHISRDEQRKRIQMRIDDPDKRWKFSSADLKERTFWDDYQRAYEAAIYKCATKSAPWHIVSANNKWYRNLAVSRILRATLEEMNPQFPPAEKGIEGLRVK